MKQTYEELNAIQKYLTAKLIKAIKSYDFEEAEKLLAEIKPIDKKRRKLWNKEKFGAYKNIVDETILHFSADDIPF